MGSQAVKMCSGCISQKQTLQLQSNFTNLQITIKSNQSPKTLAFSNKIVQSAYLSLISNKPLIASQKLNQLNAKKLSSIQYEESSQKLAIITQLKIQVADQLALYYGQAIENKPHGFGQLYLIRTQRFIQGQFIDGILTCEDAIIIQQNGDYYRGNVKNYKPDGYGQKLINGQTLSKGRFYCGEMNGRGQRQYFYDNSIYRGIFVNDEREGKGKITWNEDLFYQGNFSQDKMQGIGHLHTPKYDYYGPFKNGVKCGKGTLKLKDGRKFEGYFENDHPSGYGQLRNLNGYIQKGQFGWQL